MNFYCPSSVLQALNCCPVTPFTPLSDSISLSRSLATYLSLSLPLSLCLSPSSSGCHSLVENLHKNLQPAVSPSLLAASLFFFLLSTVVVVTVVVVAMAAAICHWPFWPLSHTSRWPYAQSLPTWPQEQKKKKPKENPRQPLPQHYIQLPTPSAALTHPAAAVLHLACKCADRTDNIRPKCETVRGGRCGKGLGRIVFVFGVQITMPPTSEKA